MSGQGAISRIVIVGGGSAGWLTAGVIAAEHGERPGKRLGKRLEVTLIESPDVAAIGVGEGTWPTMRDTLRRIGVSESDFIRECDASFKQGSQFVHWVTGRDGDDYFHPFVLPQGYTEANLAARWIERHATRPFAEQVCFQPWLCRNGRAPKQVTTPEYAAVANYAYHLDAGRFGQFLRRHCTEKLGVSWLRDNVLHVNPATNGDIASLETESGGALAGDLFIDCSGFPAMLLSGHYRVPFLSRKDVLFNDSAVALQVPYAGDAAPIASHTISQATAAGWIWDIGLPTRRGIGHVYSSAHTTTEAAEEALIGYIERTGGGPAARLGAPRRIAFDPGHRETFWHRNCVAVGLSAGFIEPLEASALALIELSAAMISDEMPATRDVMDIVARRFNERFRYRWDRVIEFLKLHYVLSRRDAPFWVDNRRPESIPPRLRELLSLWRYRPPSRYDFVQVEEIFPSASYQYVLYGMGFRPDPALGIRGSDAPEQADAHFAERERLTAKMLAGLPSNRALIEHVRRNGLPRI